MYPFNVHETKKNLQTLVENRTIFQSDNSELNLFETYQEANQVNLEFEYPVVVSMLRGKKVMHLSEKPEFDFYPGQSLVMPIYQEMIIDFPGATMDAPTRCLALGLDPQIIREITAQHAELISIERDPDLQLDVTADPSRLNESTEIEILIQRIMLTFTKESESRDILINMMLKELVVRLLQSEARYSLLKASADFKNSNRMAYIVEYIKENLSDKISVEQLARKVYMSASNFHKVFRDTLGQSPINFINQERIHHAKHLMDHSRMTISEIAHAVGFNDPAYFSRLFKKTVGKSPRKYMTRKSGVII